MTNPLTLRERIAHVSNVNPVAVDRYRLSVALANVRALQISRRVRWAR